MKGKTQKFSKGYSSGFVPDYRHAVETVGESEGFVSPARIDSEDSCAPKRKCISLNVETCDSFNVPLQVINLSKMCGSEKKEAEMRLRKELEQVRILQKRILSKCVSGVNSVSLSSSTDIRVKKQDQVGQHASQLKRGNSGRFESAKPAPPLPAVNNTHLMLMKQCEALLKRLMAHPHAWVFNTPVDVVKLNIPDYFQVIKHPMDLGTVKSKITSGAYSSPWGFVSDVRLAFTNAMTYNPPGNDVHVMADVMSKFFETRWKPVEKKLTAADAALKKETKETKPVLQPKKRKASPQIHSIPPEENAKAKMTDEQKLNLSRQLETLAGEVQELIVDFLRRHFGNEIQANEDEIEIDIDSLSDDALFGIEKLVNDYSREKQSGNQEKDEPYEMEILNESGLSNSSTHHGRGNELADEDVDIGGNDLPLSSFPPVVIEKDTAPRSSKCSSSSSSSSDSGSSSSDSDSSSSSGSGSDVKVSGAMKVIKDNAQSRGALDQEKSDILNPFDANRSSNELSQPEQDSHPKLVSIEVDRQREGENTPCQRQVSPGKQYRAALLRGRFADTILKAREKTLNQGEKKDPEKLRHERQELERLHREEKARLQAEAKAAEDARRRAEAEAIAEAKRKRELEREAARQALLQMEKTVEINEGSLFLKDLEMLRTVPGEQVPSSVGETSPAQPQEGVGGFELGSNALEQLGLYMKVDYDEEDECEPANAPLNDVEEGEID